MPVKQTSEGVKNRMKLVLIRHGHSHHSVTGVISDINGCTGLTDRGHEQAALLAARLAQCDFAAPVALLSSPVLRARQTAEVIRPALGDVDVLLDPDLRELVPGVADGLTREEYSATYGAFDLVANPDRPYAPGGESWFAFRRRVERTFERFVEQHEHETLVAVSHAGFIVVGFLIRFAVPSRSDVAFLEPQNTGVTIWESENRKRWNLITYNDTSHLHSDTRSQS
jgi:probable phosphoglycerate mutase